MERVFLDGAATPRSYAPFVRRLPEPFATTSFKESTVVQITIAAGVAVLEVHGLDKLWALKSRLEIPLAHIRGVRADPQIAHRWWHGIRAPGTNVPGVLTAGTFYEHGKRVFWDVHDPERTIVIELEDERYDELIIEVADASSTVRLLRSNIAKRTA